MGRLTKSNIDTAESNSLTVHSEDIKALEDRLASAMIKIREIDKQSQDIKKDFISIFGLFASLVTFLSVEVAVFKNIARFSLVMAVSMFFLSALILFSVTLQNILKDRDKISDYLSPPCLLATFFFIASMLFFAWSAPF